MTLVIAPWATKATTGFVPPDLTQLTGDVIGLAVADARAATRLVRTLLVSLPEASHGEFAAGVARRLDDRTLQALSQTAAGRDLLVALASRPHDQISRLSDALYAVVRVAATASAHSPQRESRHR